jgi:sugar lactone lactonase YvrE
VHSFSGDLAFLDGLAVDVAGNAYVLVTGMNQLVQLDRAGTATVVATHVEDGLNVPASLAFGVQGVSKRTLYVTNFSLPPLVALAGSEPPTPGVLAVDVPLPGAPLTP